MAAAPGVPDGPEFLLMLAAAPAIAAGMARIIGLRRASNGKEPRRRVSIWLATYVQILTSVAGMLVAGGIAIYCLTHSTHGPLGANPTVLISIAAAVGAVNALVVHGSTQSLRNSETKK